MTIDGDESMTTEGLRAALEAKTGMPVPRMLFKGKALADGELVSFYGIEAKVLRNPLGRSLARLGYSPASSPSPPPMRR